MIVFGEEHLTVKFVIRVGYLNNIFSPLGWEFEQAYVQKYKGREEGGGPEGGGGRC